MSETNNDITLPDDVMSYIVGELREIKALLSPQSQPVALDRDYYSIQQLSELTHQCGIRPYQPYTLRRAAAEGRLRAEKLDDGKSWRVRMQDVRNVLEKGIPPERRHQS